MTPKKKSGIVISSTTHTDYCGPQSELYKVNAKRVQYLINFKKIYVANLKSSCLDSSGNGNSRTDAHNSWINTHCNEAPERPKPFNVKSTSATIIRTLPIQRKLIEVM